MGFSSHNSASPMRARAASARWRGSLRNSAPWRRASSSRNWKPALCRVRAYSVPGLPSPTINLSGSPAIRISRPAETPPAAFDSSEAAGDEQYAGVYGYFFPPSFLAGPLSFFSSPFLASAAGAPAPAAAPAAGAAPGAAPGAPGAAATAPSAGTAAAASAATG